MKKILMTLSLALCAAFAIPTVANAQSATTTTTEKTAECCKEKKECCKEEGKACCKKDGKAFAKDGKKGMRKAGKMAKADRRMKGPKDGGKMRRGGENPMFKGITLSEEQKTQMKALREKNMTAEKKTKAEMKAKSKDEMQKLRAEFDKEVEKILDKDQLKQYQANKAEMEARRSEKQAKLPKLEKKDK